MGVIINLSWVDFGCDNIHSGPICCEQAGTVSNCYSTSCTAQHRVSRVFNYVVISTRVEVELGCDNYMSCCLVLYDQRGGHPPVRLPWTPQAGPSSACTAASCSQLLKDFQLGWLAISGFINGFFLKLFRFSYPHRNVMTEPLILVAGFFLLDLNVNILVRAECVHWPLFLVIIPCDISCAGKCTYPAQASVHILREFITAVVKTQ